MAVNRDRPDIWKADIVSSVDMFNRWFMRFAPEAFRKTRAQTTTEVETAFAATDNLTKVSPKVLREDPKVLRVLRMATCPPLAVDRLIGLAGVAASLIKRMENDGKLPSSLKGGELNSQLKKVGRIITKMADVDILVWLSRKGTPTKKEIYRAATVVADRLCGAVANPIIRNAQERRQLDAIARWLAKRGYQRVQGTDAGGIHQMNPGTYCFRMNVPVRLEDRSRQVNIPVDAVIKPVNSAKGKLPVLFEAKSAGDFTNVNKRRKEEAVKMSQLRKMYGDRISYNLFLCGYFDSGYLGYEAAEGID